jgi:hypothetical protein
LLFREIISSFWESHKYCAEKNAELFNAKAGGTYSNHCFKGLSTKPYSPSEDLMFA